MVQIIQENRKPTFLEQLGTGFEGFMSGLEQAQARGNEQRRNMLFSELLSGGDLSQQDMGMFSPEEQLKASTLMQKQQEGQQKQLLKAQEEIAPLMGAMDTVQRMREIRSQGNLGMFSRATQFLPGGSDVRRDRGEYSQLGKSLIQYATNIPIRNKMEFETLAERLYDPNVTDAEAEGILDSMERIISGSLSQYGVQMPYSQKLKQSSFVDTYNQGRAESDRGQRPELKTFLG